MQTEQLTTVNILNLFETTKKERETFVDDIVSRLESGQADAIKVHLQIKCMESIVKDLNSNEKYKDYLLDAAGRNGKKFTYHNAEFSIKEVGTKYDYSQCNDAGLNELQVQADQLADKIKARQKFLQMIAPEGIDIITSDGEAIKIYAPSKTSTTSVAVTLK